MQTGQLLSAMRMECFWKNACQIEVLRDRNGALYSILFGDFMIAGLSDDNFCSLSEEQMKYYLQAYQNPELFCIDRDTGKIGIVRSSQFPSREEFDHCYDKLLANGEMAAVKELLR